MKIMKMIVSILACWHTSTFAYASSVLPANALAKEDCAATAAFANVSDARRAECASRAAELVAKMSGEEKLSLLLMNSSAVPRLGIDAYHWWNEALHGVARSADWVKASHDTVNGSTPFATYGSARKNVETGMFLIVR